MEELKPIPTSEEKRQAYDQMIHRSNQLRQENCHHPLAISEIDRRVYEKQKKLKKKANEDQQQLDKRKRKQYRIKMKMITPTEVSRIGAKHNDSLMCSLLHIDSKGTYQRLHARIQRLERIKELQI